MEGRAFLRGPPCPLLDGSDLLLHQFFDKTLQENPGLAGRDALSASDGETLTFDQLNRRANQLAARLVQNIPPSSEGADRIVIVCMLPGIDLIVSLLAVFKTGAAYLPVDPSFPADRVAYIIEDSQAVMFLTSDSVLQATAFASVPEGRVPVFDVESFKWDEQEVAHPANRTPCESDGRKLAVVLYTSGSTGTPKGVRLDHRTILHRLNWQWHAFPFGEEEVSCFKTALTFVDSISEIWAPLLIGRSVQIVPKHVTRDTQRFIDLLSRCKVSRLVLVPSLMKAILTFLKAQSQCDAYLPLKHLKMWICSGEVLTKELLLEFYDCFPAGTILADYYGSTEVMGDVTYSAFESQDQALTAMVDNKVPIGIPVDDVAIYLLNEKKELVGPGEIGEIYVAGAHMCSGYIRNREMDRFTKNHIDDTPGYETMFRTGDYGRIINGMVYYEGRADSQVKIRGHRVDLNEVNGIVYRLSDLVAACVVLCYKAGEPDQEMVAFVVPKNGNENSIDLIKERLKQKLISYMMPKLVEVDEMPLLVNGKVDRQKLLRLFAEQRQQQKDAAKCDVLFNENELTKEERALLRTVISVVGTTSVEDGKPVQLTDNFFEIGGNSLNAVNVVTKLKDQGFNLDLTSFLAASRLQDLIGNIQASQANTEQSDFTSRFIMEMLSDVVKEDVIRIISTSFSKKAELELLTGVIYDDYDIFMRQLWEPLVAANLSFVLKDDEDRVLAVALNFDVFDEPVVEPHVKRLAYVFEFLEDIEAPVREKHFQKRTNVAIHSFMMATDASCSAADNVFLIRRMEQETLGLAKERGFTAVFTTNTNELTRQVCDDLLDYQILFECQVNRYMAHDGTRPFADAPDSQYSTVTVKSIH